MKKTVLMIFLLIAVFTLSAEVVSIPGLGDVGFTKINSQTYEIAIPKLGSYEFSGYFNNKKDFQLAGGIPAGDFTDYIPVVGQILALCGLDTMTLEVSPRGGGVTIHLEGGGLGILRGRITESLSKIYILKVAINEIISTLEIESVDIKGMLDGNTLKGRIWGSVSVLTFQLGFDVDGDLSISKIVTALTDKIYPKVKNFALDIGKRAYNKTKDVVLSAGRSTLNAANRLIDEVGVIAHDVKTSVSHGSHSFGKCYNNCTVHYADRQRHPLLDGSNRMFIDFYNSVYKDLRSVYGENDQETRALRSQLINDQWNQLVSQLDNKWQHVFDDDEVENYFFKDSSERKARERYRNLVGESWNHHRNFRNAKYEELMQVALPFRPIRTAQEALDQLQFWAENRIALSVRHQVEDIAWDIVWDDRAIRNENGPNVVFWNYHGAQNQQWYFKPAGKPNTYFIQSAATGKYIHIAGANDAIASSLATWEGASLDYPQTYFTASASDTGMIRLYTQKGFAFDLAGGNPVPGVDLRLWEINNSSAQSFYISPAEHPATLRPGIYRIRASHSNNLYMTVDAGNENGKNISLQPDYGNNQTHFRISAGSTLHGHHAWSIQSVHSGLYIHTEGVKFDAGTNILTWEGAGGENTFFNFQKNPDGSYVAWTLNGQVIECAGEGEPGTNIILYNYGGAPDQHWVLEPVAIY